MLAYLLSCPLNLVLHIYIRIADHRDKSRYFRKIPPQIADYYCFLGQCHVFLLILPMRWNLFGEEIFGFQLNLLPGHASIRIKIYLNTSSSALRFQFSSWGCIYLYNYHDDFDILLMSYRLYLLLILKVFMGHEWPASFNYRRLHVRTLRAVLRDWFNDPFDE